jgi:Mor family transcriptional regulator
MKNNSQANIQCPIDLFPNQEEEIGRLTEMVNQAQSAAQKKTYAQALIEVVAVLLACQSYDEENQNCRLCHDISGLRHKTYSLVVKAGQLDENRRHSEGRDR